MSRKAEYFRFADKIDEHKFINETIQQCLSKLCSGKLCSDKLCLSSDLADDLFSNIQVVWSNKLKTTAGTARCDKLITISNSLWLRGNIEQRKEIITHETCHLVVYNYNRRVATSIYEDKNNYFEDRRSHGRKWQEYMQICGYQNPQRCHTIIPKRRLFLWVCSCREYKIKVRLHNKGMQIGLHCKFCNQPCKFVNEIRE